MKHFVYLLLCLLLCACVLVPAAAKTAPDDPEPAPATVQTADTAQPEPRQPLKFSPYEKPHWEDYHDDYTAYADDYSTWMLSKYGRYYHWSTMDRDSTPPFDPAFRAYYADDPNLTIADHFVYRIVDVLAGYQNNAPVWKKMAYVIDFFDSDAAEKACTMLRIPAKLGGYPVKIAMFRTSDYADGYIDSRYTNNTVKKIIFEKGLTTVDPFAFSNFTALQSVVLPDTVKSIGVHAFQGCSKLKKVTGGEHVKLIDSSAFDGCIKLSNFEYLENVKEIHGAAFRGCAFKTLTLSGMVALGGVDEDNYLIDYTFGECTKLQKVTFLPGSKKKALTFGDGTFIGCTALKTVILPTKSKEIRIGDRTFDSCTALKTVKNTGKVVSIGRMAFCDCFSLNAITLPAKLQQADFDAFRNCKSLKTVTLLSKDKTLFDKDYVPYIYYGNEPEGAFRVSGNFLPMLPKTCTLLVVNKTMKDAVKAHGFKGTVKIRVNVSAPQNFTCRANRNGTVTFLWDPVKKASGYRLYIFDAATDRWVALRTTTKTSVTIKPTELRAGYVVRAYRVIDGDKSWSGYSDYAKVLLA